MNLLLALIALASADPATEAAHDALAPRHLAVDCAALRQQMAQVSGEDADSEALSASLVALAESDPMPPWVGPRAARCVTETLGHSPAAQDAARRWLASPDQLGLARIVAGRLELAPPTLASELRATLAERRRTDERARRLLPE